MADTSSPLMDDYLLAGCFLTVTAHRPTSTDKSLIPEQVPTLSGCLAGFVPTVYWNDYLNEEEQGLGLRPDDLPHIKAWTEAHFNVSVGFPDVFYSLEAARAFAAAFIKENPRLIVLGAGLHKACAKDLIYHEQLSPQIGENGVFFLLSKAQALPPGGLGLGHELVSYERGLMDSWLCDGLEGRAAEQGVMLNRRGLIDSYTRAKQLANEINRERVHEPTFFYPWLIVQYPLYAD